MDGRLDISDDYRNSSSYARRGRSQRPVRPNYICKRCGIPGHHIADCKTNGDPNFDDNQGRPVRLHNVPMSTMKKVEKLDGIDLSAVNVCIMATILSFFSLYLFFSHITIAHTDLNLIPMF